MQTITQTKTTAFIYIRVSTPSQQVDEQLKIVRQFVKENNIEVIGQYGDYRKRHGSGKAKSFQTMLEDIERLKPNVIVVQRPSRLAPATVRPAVDYGEFPRQHLLIGHSLRGLPRGLGDLFVHFPNRLLEHFLGIFELFSEFVQVRGDNISDAAKQPHGHPLLF